MTTKGEIYRLIEELPEDELVEARRLLRHLRDRNVLAEYPAVLHDAPIDDEPETEEERKRGKQARAAM